MKKCLAVILTLALFFIQPHVDKGEIVKSNASRAIFVMAPL
ncbi:hypothetical protein [Candidatus Epulonipiscium viviparus]|nr:hypothetical protein [Candidatus Epulopiscium viviparus]